MGQTTSKKHHKLQKRKSISKLFHAQTGSIWFQIGSYWFLLVPMGSIVHRLVPTNLKWFPNCSPSHTLFQDRCSRWFSTLYILSPNFHTKRSSTQVDQSWRLFDQQSFNATEEDHFLESNANHCFTAPKMRFCSDLFAKYRGLPEARIAGATVFFCSNASIALARSLCKYLLAVLITASEANTVAGFMDSWCQAV